MLVGVCYQLINLLFDGRQLIFESSRRLFPLSQIFESLSEVSQATLTPGELVVLGSFLPRRQQQTCSVRRLLPFAILYLSC